MSPLSQAPVSYIYLVPAVTLHYVYYSNTEQTTMQLTLTDHELLLIRAALKTVSPAGGGSAPFNLYRRMPDVGQHPDTNYSMEDEDKLVMRFANTVIDDAVECGAIELATDNRT